MALSVRPAADAWILLIRPLMAPAFPPAEHMGAGRKATECKSRS